MSEYPELAQLLGGYMYQYFTDDYGNEWRALSEYVRESPQSVPTLQSDITRLLRDKQTEDRIASVILDDFGWSYDMTQTGGTWRDWLTRVSDEAGRLAAHPGAA